MSWEDDRTDIRPCPCGKGNSSVTYRSDDWGRHDEVWSMHCPQCQKTYGLYCYVRNYEMISETYYLWVPKQDLRELENLEAAIQKHEDGVAAYLEHQYGVQWMRHFEGKSKKRVWTELTNDGQCYPQLSTFYGQVRGVGLERVLSGYLRYDTVDTVTHLLNLRDSMLASHVRRMESLKSKLVAKNKLIRAAGVR